MTTDTLDIIDLAEQFAINIPEETVPLNQEVDDTEVLETEEKEEEVIEEPVDNIKEQLKAFAQELKNRNILESETEIEDEDTLFQEFDKGIEKKALEKISAEYDLDNPKVKSVLSYIKNGGNIESFIEIQKDFNSEVNLEDEDSMSNFLNECLESFNNVSDEEDRNDFIENLKVKGKLKEKTEYFQNYIKTQKEKVEQDLFEKQEAHKIKLEQQRKEQDKLIKESIKSGNINGFKINVSKKTEFEDFLYKPVIKEINGKKIQTSLFKERFDECLQDPLKFTRLAYELFENFSNTTVKATVEKQTQSNFLKTLKQKEEQNQKNYLENII